MLIAKTIQCIVFGPLRVSEKQVSLGFHLVEGLSTCHYIFWVFIKPFYSQQFASAFSESIDSTAKFRILQSYCYAYGALN